MHFAVLGNHIHLIVEAHDAMALAAGMKSFTVGVARGLNGMMGVKGRVFSDRFHSRVLRSPSEIVRAVEYVLTNFQEHARRRGEPLPDDFVDPYTSAFIENCDLVCEPETWLLQVGWKRATGQYSGGRLGKFTPGAVRRRRPDSRPAPGCQSAKRCRSD